MGLGGGNPKGSGKAVRGNDGVHGNSLSGPGGAVNGAGRLCVPRQRRFFAVVI
ncbi:hypothetical protein AGMMS49936_05190 [Endomicrobiia bacterium]|nr:hypothetical protein AGMMS49936_05190 [Endomicrobiia bacterium]